MHAEVRLILRGDLDHLQLVWQAAETVIQDVPFAPEPEYARHSLLLGLQEMVTNILRHGYGGDTSRPIEVVLRLDEDRLEVALLDEGPPFDPTARVCGPVDRHRESGRGIPFVRSIMDEVYYHRVDDRNVLTLTKRLPVYANRPPAEA